MDSVEGQDKWQVSVGERSGTIGVLLDRSWQKWLLCHLKTQI